MGRRQRQRWDHNVKAIEISHKPIGQITEEERKFLRENYTGEGGLIPNGYHGGAFYTPPHLAKFIVELLNVKEGSKVLEPSCGAGVFFEHIPKSCEITGIELNITSARIARILYPHVNIIRDDALYHNKENYYDYVIGNPPFGLSVSIDADKSNYKSLTKRKGKYTGKSENAFLELAIKSVKYGGYIAMIVPLGLSFSQQAKRIRQLIYNTCWHVATIKLPPETFQHVGTSIPTYILVLRKVPPTVKKIESPEIKGAYFFEGQQPSLMAEITDIGWDKKGRSTDKWGDGLTQLDELVDMIKLNHWQTDLVRENLYPWEPSWVYADKDIDSFMFPVDGCKGMRDAQRYIGLVPHWHEMTLGVRDDDRSFDFTWQDELVEEYYQLKEIENKKAV